jgi:type III secretion protein T
MTYVGQINTWLLALLLTMPRVLGFFLALPFISGKTVPGMARNALVLIITAFAMPMTVDTVSTLPFELSFIFLIIVKEVAIGFIFGYMLSIPFWVMGSAGFFLDLQRGSMSAQLFSPVLSDQSSSLGDLFAKLAVALLFSTGGFLLLIEVLLESYLAWPVHSYFPHFNLDSVGIVIGQFGSIFVLAALVAAPIVATMYIVEFGVAFVARYVPQLNVFLLVMPIKSGIAMLLLVFYIVYISRYVREGFFRFNEVFNMTDTMLQ